MQPLQQCTPLRYLKKEGCYDHDQYSTEYIDIDHEVMSEYYDLCETYTGKNWRSTKKKLKKLIEKDPDFLDSYTFLHEILFRENKVEEAKKVLNEAYERALKLITDENGNWPDVLEWV
ncbi:MAG: hypothetical protein PVF58_17105 [Candidatus Methanofastidiosia archaeon]